MKYWIIFDAMLGRGSFSILIKASNCCGFEMEIMFSSFELYSSEINN